MKNRVPPKGERAPSEKANGSGLRGFGLGLGFHIILFALQICVFSFPFDDFIQLLTHNSLQSADNSFV